MRIQGGAASVSLEHPGGTGGGVISCVLAGLVAVASLNGIGLGSAEAPLTLPRWLLYLPAIGLAYWIGLRRRIRWPALPVAAGVATTLGAAVLHSFGMGVTMLLFSTLTVGLPWLIGQALRHRSELAAAAWERLEQVEATREAYAIAASTSLRHQLAADLHDHVGHELALIALQAGALETTTDGANREAATRLRELASDATDRLRTVVGQLTEDGRGPHSVADVAARANSTGLTVTLKGDSHNPLLVRAAQEALTNAARHATGQPVQITAGPAALLVTNDVTDNVDDSAITSAPSDPESRDHPTHGLSLLTERVNAVGGQMLAGRGGETWRLSIRLPPPP